MKMESHNDQPSQSDDVSWGQWFGMALVASAILAGFEFLVYRALALAQRGDKTVAIWEPIAVVYELWGYGAALAVIPMLWLLLMAIVAWQTWIRLREGKSPQTPKK